MTFAIVIGRNGGFYFKRVSIGIRLCLWRVAFDVYTLELEDMLRAMKSYGQAGGAE